MTSASEVLVDITVASATDAVPLIRRTIDDAARRHEPTACDEAVEQLLVVVSELATNAVVHAGAGCRMIRARCLVGGGRWRIELCDGGSGLPALGPHDNLEATGGRGLHIVDVLAERWGTFPADDGKTVWADVTMIHQGAPP